MVGAGAGGKPGPGRSVSGVGRRRWKGHMRVVDREEAVLGREDEQAQAAAETSPPGNREEVDAAMMEKKKPLLQQCLEERYCLFPLIF